MQAATYRKIGKETCMPSRGEESWSTRTGDRPGEVLGAFRELRTGYYCLEQPGIHYVPGFLATTPIMYIPKTSCVRVIAEKKATTRFLLKVSAYRLLNR